MAKNSVFIGLAAVAAFSLSDKGRTAYRASGCKKTTLSAHLMAAGRIHLLGHIGGEAIGGIGLVLHDDIERCSAEVGYWVSQTYWGRGIGTEALKAFTRYAFGAFDLKRLYAVPFLQNSASLKVLEKAGYQREGIMRRSAIKDGQIVDQALYALVGADFSAG